MSHQCTCGLHGEFKFPLTSQYFCSSCFSLKFEKKILRRIPRYVRGHTISIALSGGKDSTTLLHILRKYSKKLRITMLVAIILEEEIPTIQSSREKVINKLKANYPEIQFIQKSYSELFGYSLPHIVQQSDKQELGYTPCAICGVLRRHGILRLALEIGVDFIATGSTLQDEAETTILNLMRGNPWKNYRDQIEYHPVDSISLPSRIKPLARTSEKTIRQYTSISDLPFVKNKCLYADRSLRSQISTFLTTVAKKDQLVLYNIVSSTKKERMVKKQIKKVYKCQSCSSYSHESKCSACRIIDHLF